MACFLPFRPPQETGAKSTRNETHLKSVQRLSALARDNSYAVDERYYVARTLLFELDFRLEQLESLDARRAVVVQRQVLAVPLLQSGWLGLDGQWWAEEGLRALACLPLRTLKKLLAECSDTRPHLTSLGASLISTTAAACCACLLSCLWVGKPTFGCLRSFKFVSGFVAWLCLKLARRWTYLIGASILACSIRRQFNYCAEFAVLVKWPLEVAVTQQTDLRLFARPKLEASALLCFRFEREKSFRSETGLKVARVSS